MTQGLTRRRFLRGAAGLMGTVALGGAAGLGSEAAGTREPTFDSLVVVTMENRSFDHLLGWLPGADGRQAGAAYRDAAGALHPTHPLAPDFRGCGHPDPAHNYGAGRREYAGGAADGWLRAGANDRYAIGYYGRDDLAFLGRAAPQWTTLSRYFPAIMAGTFANRIYQHAGQTDRLHNTTERCTLTTIWDRLADAGLTGRYYYSDIPILALWGKRHRSLGRPLTSFFADCASGALPHLAYVDPSLRHERSGRSGDDHPHADIRTGEAFMSDIYNAVTTGPGWPRTLLMFTYDEWGGFFDHVAPPAGPIPAADRAAGNGDGLRGFRVPCVLVSPYVRRGHVGTQLYDHASILRTVEARWELPPLTVRDASANDLTTELDPAAPNLNAPQYNAPRAPGGHCKVKPHSHPESRLLIDVAQASGWPIYGK